MRFGDIGNVRFIVFVDGRWRRLQKIPPIFVGNDQQVRTLEGRIAAVPSANAMATDGGPEKMYRVGDHEDVLLLRNT